MGELKIQSEQTKLATQNLFEDKVLLSGSRGANLTSSAASILGVPSGNVLVEHFSDGEISVDVRENVRDRDVYVIHGTSAPVNESLMELCLTLDALKRASAKQVTVLMPYMGYSRQDRRTSERGPVSAALVSKLITTSGADRIVTVDIHSEQSTAFFGVPVDNIHAAPLFVEALSQILDGEDAVIVSPDASAVKRARSIAEPLNLPMAIIDKRRTGPNRVGEVTLIGDVKGKCAVIVDDIIDTGGTLMKAAAALRTQGATAVIACCVHGVLSGDAQEKLQASQISQLIITDTVPHESFRSEKIVVLPVAELLAEVIGRMVRKDSLVDMRM